MPWGTPSRNAARSGASARRGPASRGGVLADPGPDPRPPFADGPVRATVSFDDADFTVDVAYHGTALHLPAHRLQPKELVEEEAFLNRPRRLPRRGSPGSCSGDSEGLRMSDPPRVLELVAPAQSPTSLPCTVKTPT